jgi:iron(III) transport system permease protein
MATTTVVEGGLSLNGLVAWFAHRWDGFRIGMAREPAKYTIMLTAVALLAALVIYPVYLLFEFSILTPKGELTIQNYVEVFTRKGLIEALMNSLMLGFFVPLGCLVLGLPMAWMVSRTNMPGKLFVRAFAGIAFVIPSFIGSIGWIFLLAPNSGQLNKLFRAWFDVDFPLFDIFTIEGLIFILSVHYFPLVLFAVSASLDNMDPSYEEAARNLGAGRVRTALTVTLPLVTPAILSGMILCILDALAAFGAPAAIGFAAGFEVLTTKIYTLLLHPPKFELAAAVAVPIVFFTAVCLVVQKWWLGRGRYTTLTGKAGQAQAMDLGRWRWAAFAFCFAVIFFAVLLPMSGLLILSLLNTFGAPIEFRNMVLENYEIFFDDTFIVIQSIKNSFILAISSATFCIMLGVVYVWIVERTNIVGRGAVTFIIMITFGFPAVAMGVGVLIGYINWIYATLWILFVAYMAKKIPFAYIFLRNAIKQIMEELEEAARIAGATWARMVWDITIPLMKTGMWIAWVLIFSIALRELAMSILLAQPGTETMAVAVFSFLEDGAVEHAAAVSVVIALLSVATVIVARKIAGTGALEVD